MTYSIGMHTMTGTTNNSLTRDPFRPEEITYSQCNLFRGTVECQRCGSVIGFHQKTRHTEWHNMLSRQAEEILRQAAQPQLPMENPPF